MTTPQVTIVTPSFNQGRFLPDTLESVRRQDYPDIEHIVMDGGSTDGSVDILRQAPRIHWRSEPDRGQVDAINKGLARASGEILAWLNSDDTLSPNAVSTAVAALDRTGADMVYGDLEIVSENGSFLRGFRGVPFDFRVLLYGINYIGQQTVFFRRGLLQKAGPLREEFDNCFDFELWLRFAQHGKLVYAPEIRAQIRVHPAAKSVARNDVTQANHKKILGEYWSRGGLPRLFQRQPWFKPVNLYYRLKRQIIIKTAGLPRPSAGESSSSRAGQSTVGLPKPERHPKILMIGYLPPPYFGPSATYTALLRSEFPHRFDVTFLDITVAKSVGDIERFRIGKLFKMVGFLLRECWLLVTHRFDFACALVSVNRNAFIKDAALLGLARAFGVPTVLYAHGNNIPDFHDRSRPWMQRLIARTCRRAAGAIVLGECLRFNFDRWLPQERIFVVPTGFVPMDAVPKVSKQPGVVTVVYLGGMTREKGVLVLLEAIPKVVAQKPNTRFRLAGAWWRHEDRLEAERIIRDHDLQQHVEFVGVVTGVAKWRLLAECDVLVFPTFYYYETFGLVLLEAMEAGLPVVATRRAAIPEIIREGVNGLFVEEQDPSDLAEKILQLIDDPGLRERMGKANRERFASYYTHEHYGQRMIGVFEQLAARQGR